MRVSWIKYEKDKESFKMPEKLGFDVFILKELEDTDKKIKELIEENYKAIIVSNEVAAFSEDIIKKYKYDTDISIIISQRKE